MFKFLLVLASLFILVGCRDDEVVTDETLPPTVYFAADASLGDDGWQHFVTVIVNADNVVTDIAFDSIGMPATPSRRLISQGTTYVETFGYSFYEQAMMLEQALRGVLRDELVEGILTAYQEGMIDFNPVAFAHLAEIALASPPVARGPYLDGIYSSYGEVNEAGYQYFVNLFIIHGNILAAHWNAINLEDGTFKYTPSSTAADESLLEWRNQAALIEEALIAFQDPMMFSFDVNGFTDEIPGVYIEIESVVALFTAALATGRANPE